MKTFLQRLSLFVLLVMPFTTVNAQIVDLGKMRFGVRSGLSAANLLFVEAPTKFGGYCPDGGCRFLSNSENYMVTYKGGIRNTRFGLLTGLFAERTINNKLALEIGLNFEQKGINVTNTEYNSEQDKLNSNTSIIYKTEKWEYFKREIRNDYLIVPVVAKYKFNSTSRYFVVGGVYVGYLLNESGTLEDSTGFRTTVSDGENIISQSWQYFRSREEVDTELTTTFDAGFVAGGGASWPLGKSFALELDARVNVGMLKVDKKYNNRFEEKKLSPVSGYSSIIISENYYRGLNSQARNINLTLAVGISRSF